MEWLNFLEKNGKKNLASLGFLASTCFLKGLILPQKVKTVTNEGRVWLTLISNHFNIT